MFILNIVLAFLDNILFCLSFYFSTKKRVTFVLALCNAVGLLRYLLLGAVTGVVSGFCSLVKNLSYVRDSLRVTVIMSILRVILYIIFYENILTLLFMLFELLNLVVLLKYSINHLRVVSAGRQFIWVLYDFFSGGILCGILRLISFIVVCFSIKFGKNNEESEVTV